MEIVSWFLVVHWVWSVCYPAVLQWFVCVLFIGVTFVSLLPTGFFLSLERLFRPFRLGTDEGGSGE